MKSGRTLETFSLTAGLVVAVGWLWWLWANHEPASDSRRSPVAQHESDANPPLPNLDFGDARNRVADDVAVVPPTGEAEIPSGAIAGQRVWKVKDIDAAVAAARAAGLEVLGVIPELGLVRVAGNDAALAAALPADAAESFVFPVGLPSFPSPERVTIEGLAPFLDAALKKLGIEKRSDTWGQGVRIALLDTGVSDHPALANANISGGRTDLNGHGTAMASLLVGTDPYVQGLSPAAELIVFPVLDANGQGDTFELARGIIAAVDWGAQIIPICAGAHEGGTTLQEAVDYATEHGVLIVAASGNDGAEFVREPAAYKDVVAVNPIDANGSKPGFANFGDAIDLAAPGVMVYTAWANNEYVAMSGSSASTPFVASAVAMLMSENSGWTAQQAYAALLATTDDLGKPGVDPVFGAGAIDLGRTLRNAAGSAIDLAVIPPYVALDEQSDGVAPVYLSLQNQGTETLNGTRLDLVVNGISYTYTVGTLAAGESRGVQIPLSLSQMESVDGITIESKAFLPASVEDVKPENNSITARLRLSADDEEGGG